jgi:hypothetical protein
MSRAQLTRLAKCMAFASWLYDWRGDSNGNREPITVKFNWSILDAGMRRRWLRAARLAAAQTQRKAKR